MCVVLLFALILQMSHSSKENRIDRREPARQGRIGRDKVKLVAVWPFIVKETARGEGKKASSCVEFWQECRKLDLVAFQPGSLPIMLGYPSQAAYGSASSQAITK